jgi:hypothetical protein
VFHFPSRKTTAPCRTCWALASPARAFACLLIALTLLPLVRADPAPEEPPPKKPKLCWRCPACKCEIPCEPWQEKRLTLCPSCHRPMIIDIDHHYSNGRSEILVIAGAMVFAAAAFYRLVRIYLAKKRLLREGQPA